MTTTHSIHALRRFQEALQSGASIKVYANGTWAKRWTITTLFMRLFGMEEKAESELAHFVENHFAKMEANYQTIRCALPQPSNDADVTYREMAKTVTLMKKRLVRFCKNKELPQETTKAALLKKVTPLLAFDANVKASKRTSEKAQKKLLRLSELKKKIKELDKEIKEKQSKAYAEMGIYRLDRRLLSLKYRTQSEQKELDQKRFKKDLSFLKTSLLLWKEQQYPPLSKGLDGEEMRRLEETCKYQDLVDLLKKDPFTLKEYFSYIFRNTIDGCKDSVHIFAQFPTISNQLTKSFLDKRESAVQNDGIRFLEKEKDVQILIDGKYVSLRDDTAKIIFDGEEQSHTLREILKSFEDKNKDMGEFEFFQKGILHSYPKEMKLNLDDKENWWKDIPVYKTMTKEEVEKKHGLPLEEGEPLTVFMGSRQTDKELRVDNTHAWVELYFPKEDGTYDMIPLGKYAYSFPNGLLSTFFFIFKTHRAFIGVDENPGYTHRQKTGFPVPLNKKQFKRCLEKIRKDMIEAKKKRLVFQMQGDNCATWVQDLFDETCKGHKLFKDKELPKLYQMNIIETKTPYPICYLSSFFKFLADKVHPAAANIVRIFMGVICGATVQYVADDKENHIRHRVSLSSNENWLRSRINLPAYLFKIVKNLREEHLGERIKQKALVAAAGA